MPLDRNSASLLVPMVTAAREIDRLLDQVAAHVNAIIDTQCAYDAVAKEGIQALQCAARLEQIGSLRMSRKDKVRAVVVSRLIHQLGAAGYIDPEALYRTQQVKADETLEAVAARDRELVRKTIGEALAPSEWPTDFQSAFDRPPLDAA